MLNVPPFSDDGIQLRAPGPRFQMDDEKRNQLGIRPINRRPPAKVGGNGMQPQQGARRGGLCTVLRGIAFLLWVLVVGRAAPAPQKARGRSFWAAAREADARKALKRRRSGWQTKVPFGQGSLSYQGASAATLFDRCGAEDDDSAETKRRRGAPSPLDFTESFVRSVGHRKEDEGLSYAWSMERFGPAMLLSGEAAMRATPAPGPEEQDELNDARRHKVYTGQTLAPESYAKNLRKLRARFDARDERSGADTFGAIGGEEQSHDARELFDVVLSSQTRAEGGAGYGHARWRTEDARQQALSDGFWRCQKEASHDAAESVHVRRESQNLQTPTDSRHSQPPVQELSDKVRSGRAGLSWLLDIERERQTSGDHEPFRCSTNFKHAPSQCVKNCAGGDSQPRSPESRATSAADLAEHRIESSVCSGGRHLRTESEIASDGQTCEKDLEDRIRREDGEPSSGHSLLLKNVLPNGTLVSNLCVRQAIAETMNTSKESSQELVGQPQAHRDQSDALVQHSLEASAKSCVTNELSCGGRVTAKEAFMLLRQRRSGLAVSCGANESGLGREAAIVSASPRLAGETSHKNQTMSESVGDTSSSLMNEQVAATSGRSFLSEGRALDAEAQESSEGNGGSEEDQSTHEAAAQDSSAIGSRWLRGANDSEVIASRYGNQVDRHGEVVQTAQSTLSNSQSRAHDEANFTSKVIDFNRSRGLGAEKEPQTTVGAEPEHAKSSGKDIGETEELGRRRRVLRALMASKEKTRQHYGLVDASEPLCMDPLDGYPTKAAILAMTRRDLESLTTTFPEILPPGHASFHRCV